MKKYMFILVACLAIFAPTSCIIEEGGYRPKATAAGKLIFDNTELVVSKNIFYADIAVKLNAYINASVDQKTVLEDRYFPTFKPRNTANKWEFANSPYSFTTDGKSLDMVGAKWIVTQNQAYYSGESGFINPLSVIIECVGDKQWKITSTDAYSYQTISNSELVAKATPYSIANTYILYDYTISGGGNFISSENYSTTNSIHVDYTIKSPMKFVFKDATGYSAINYSFTAVGGKIEMVVNNTADPNKRDLIMSDLSQSIGNNVVNRITFKGVTEVW